jgi:hypothetical protein
MEEELTAEARRSRRGAEEERGLSLEEAKRGSAEDAEVFAEGREEIGLKVSRSKV